MALWVSISRGHLFVHSGAPTKGRDNVFGKLDDQKKIKEEICRKLSPYRIVEISKTYEAIQSPEDKEMEEPTVTADNNKQTTFLLSFCLSFLFAFFSIGLYRFPLAERANEPFGHFRSFLPIVSLKLRGFET